MFGIGSLCFGVSLGLRRHGNAERMTSEGLFGLVHCA